MFSSYSPMIFDVNAVVATIQTKTMDGPSTQLRLCSLPWRPAPCSPPSRLPGTSVHLRIKFHALSYGLGSLP